MSLYEFVTARIDEDSAGARSDRMRAEVRAKRRIIDRVTLATGGHGPRRRPVTEDDRVILRILAEIWASHPDYSPDLD